MIDLEAIREKWIAERPAYKELACYVRELLKRELQHRGRSAQCSARAKDVASLVKKALRKGYGYDDIHDKAGVRVIVDFPGDVRIVESIIQECFDVRHHENKTLALPYNRLDYLGVHFEVVVKDECSAETGRWRQKLCEIQIHTRAQNCWAEISHQVIYKSDQAPPPEIKRRVYRLIALVELFDESVETARSELLKLPSFEEGRLLMDLEQWFYRLTARRFDRDLSLEIVSTLKEAYTVSERQAFAEILNQFAERHLDKLRQIYSAYRQDDRCSPLLFQPEALMVFERLEHDEFRLGDVWRLRLPDKLLRELATVWGRSI